MGMGDMVGEGVFRWLYTGVPGSYTNWQSGDPDGAEDKNCVAFKIDPPNFEWNSRSCTDSYPFVCQSRPGMVIRNYH